MSHPGEKILRGLGIDVKDFTNPPLRSGDINIFAIEQNFNTLFNCCEKQQEEIEKLKKEIIKLKNDARK